MGLQAALNREMTGFDPPSAYQLGIRSTVGPMTLNHQTRVRHLHPQPSSLSGATVAQGTFNALVAGSNPAGGTHADVVTMVST